MQHHSGRRGGYKHAHISWVIVITWGGGGAVRDGNESCPVSQLSKC